MMNWKSVTKGAITVGLLLLILNSVDLEKIDVRFEDISIAPIVAAALFLILQLIVLRAARWNWILCALDRPLPYSQACTLTAVSQFFNQVLPSTVGGDGVRILMLHREGRMLKSAVHSVILDRVFGITALLAICCVTLPIMLSSVHSSMEPEGRVFAALLVVCAPCLIIGVTLPWAARLPVLLVRNPLTIMLGQFADSAFQIWRRYRVVGILMVLSIVGHLLLSLSAWLLATAVSIELPFGAAMLALPAVFLMTAMPLSLGGWGVREGAMILALGAHGIAPENALLVSVVYGLGELSVCSAGGALWLLRRDRKGVGGANERNRIFKSTAPRTAP